MILDCPRCGTKHVQTTELWTGATPHGGPNQQIWTIAACQNPDCRGLILAIRPPTPQGEATIYPTGTHVLSTGLSISEEIRGDYREAGVCLDSGCFKASMVMSRRALQRILKEQGCAQRNLGGDDGAIAAAVNDGTLRRSFHPLANEIKEYGNLSAHPDDEQLENVTKENAQHILEFLGLLVREFYEIPGAAEAMRRRREDAKG